MQPLKPHSMSTHAERLPGFTGLNQSRVHPSCLLFPCNSLNPVEKLRCAALRIIHDSFGVESGSVCCHIAANMRLCRNYAITRNSLPYRNPLRIEQKSRLRVVHSCNSPLCVPPEFCPGVVSVVQALRPASLLGRFCWHRACISFPNNSGEDHRPSQRLNACCSQIFQQFGFKVAADPL
jgi:hypothetical protein